MLPIPDVTPIALTTFDARDPDTKYPPIRQIRPPQCAPNFVDGKKVGEGRIEQTEPFAFGEESCDVGHEAGSRVTTDYGRDGGNEFSGQVHWVEFDAGVAVDDNDHLITPRSASRWPWRNSSPSLRGITGIQV